MDRSPAGPQGISGIDKIDLPFLERFGALDLRPWYWFGLALVGLVLLVNFRLRDSRIGRAWIALREDEGAAASVGVPIVRTKLMAYGAGAALGGVAGAFLASYFSIISASSSRSRSRSSSSPWSCSAGWARSGASWSARSSLSAINNWLLPRVLHDVPSKVGLDFDLSEISAGIYGFLLVLLMLVRPEGLLPERRHRMALEHRAGSAGA